jgi:hypothetical protein
MPHIQALYRNEEGVHKALVVADVLYCGVCQPREDLVELPDLD